MNRRDFMAGIGIAAARPLGAYAQTGTPVIGFLHSGSPEQNVDRLAAYFKGLKEAGFVEGQNVAIEFHWSRGQNDKLPELAADLIHRQVTVISTAGSTPATLAAKGATATVPIVFATGADPVMFGLVASLNRPGGNATGVTSMNTELVKKRLGLIRELVPQPARHFGLLNPNSPLANPFAADLEAGGTALGVSIEFLRASTESEIDAAIAQIPQQANCVLICSSDAFFYTRREQIASLAALRAVPAIFDDRGYVESGGLLSYGADWLKLMELAGIYTGRILRGEKPADLPVTQSSKFDMALNLRSARDLGIIVPATMLALADQVIE